jgi:hypothetical protein
MKGSPARGGVPIDSGTSAMASCSLFTWSGIVMIVIMIGTTTMIRDNGARGVKSPYPTVEAVTTATVTSKGTGGKRARARRASISVA